MTNSIRLLSLECNNIVSMNFNLEFKSNLCIIYGYNRTGKTLLIKLLKYAFGGFEASNGASKFQFSKLMTGSEEGNLILTFSYKSKIYKITRKIIKNYEYLTFEQTKMPYIKYLALIPIKRKNVWNKSEKLIDNCKITTRNYQDFEAELKKIQIHLYVIKRLIATENVQEFRNATAELSGGEGGYDSIRELLFQDLKYKEDALTSLLSTNKNMESKFNIFMQGLSIQYQDFLESVKSVYSDSEVTKHHHDEIDNLIKIISLNPDPEKKINEFQESLEILEESTNKFIDLINENKMWIDNRQINFKLLEKYQNSLNLHNIEENLTDFDLITDKINTTFDFLNRIFREIETRKTNPKLIEIDKNLNNLWRDPFNKILEENGMKKIPSELQITNIDDDINTLIQKFSINLQKRIKFNQILDKYHLTNESIDLDKFQSIKKSYEDQLDCIINPPVLNPENLISVDAQIEKDANGESVLRVYMNVNKMIPYIEARNPTNISPTILPKASKKGTKFDLQSLEKLKKSFETAIEEISEGYEIFQQLAKIKESINNIISEFEKVIKIISNLKGFVDDWRKAITSKKALISDFIRKILPDVSNEIETFPELSKSLDKIEKQYALKIQEIIKKFSLEYLENESLSYNSFIMLSQFKEWKNTKTVFLNVIKDISKFVLQKEQSTYINICHDYFNSKTILNHWIPITTDIYQNFQKYIDLNAAQETIMKDIINHSESFYQSITKEDFLIFKQHQTSKNKVYLQPYLRKKDGSEHLISDDSPSGSEQAAISLGIMVAMAKFFKAFVVIDEVADRFDHPTKLRFFNAITKLGNKEMFMIIVLKVDSDKANLKEEFDQIKNNFIEADLFAPMRNPSTGEMTIERISNYREIIKEEIF